MSDELKNLDAQFEIEEIQTYDPIPDGKYQVLVEAVELTSSKAGDPMLKWTFKIVSGDLKGRKLWKYNMINSEKLKWLKQDLWTAGLELTKVSELPENLEKLLDKMLEIQKKTIKSKKNPNEEFENIYINSRVDMEKKAENDLPF